MRLTFPKLIIDSWLWRIIRGIEPILVRNEETFQIIFYKITLDTLVCVIKW